ncbi:MAG: DUF2181 domain-containing protein [Caldilineae bacterium]|nr:MAG: DUF2181 domain-containing protein [Caldilineae bacterium]
MRFRHLPYRPGKALEWSLEYLGLARPGDVHWSHGTNSIGKLAAALVDPDIHFIEGDISEGPDGRAIMAHPPATESDLAYEEWIRAIVEVGKGAKLDFKSPAVVVPALEYARKIAAERIPLIVNADVFLGPGGRVVRFQPNTFLAQYRTLLPQAILSPGWVVGSDGIGYTQQMLDEMKAYARQVRNDVTLCFHAWLLFSSWPEVKWLLDETPHTITVWGKIDASELVSWLRRFTNPARTFYDVQTPTGEQIHMF